MSLAEAQPGRVPQVGVPFTLERLNLDEAIDVFVRLDTDQRVARVMREVRVCYVRLEEAARELAIRMGGARVANVRDEMPPRVARARKAFDDALRALSRPSVEQEQIATTLCQRPAETIAQLMLLPTLEALLDNVEPADATPDDLHRVAANVGRAAAGIKAMSRPSENTARALQRGKRPDGGRPPELGLDMLLEWARLRGVGDRELARALVAAGLLPQPRGGWGFIQPDNEQGDDPVRMWESRFAMQKQRARKSGRRGGWKITPHRR